MDFDMGKYGFFVWGAYSISALAFCALIYLSLKAHKRLQKDLDNLNALKSRGADQ